MSPLWSEDETQKRTRQQTKKEKHERTVWLRRTEGGGGREEGAHRDGEIYSTSVWPLLLFSLRSLRRTGGDVHCKYASDLIVFASKVHLRVESRLLFPSPHVNQHVPHEMPPTDLF